MEQRRLQRERAVDILFPVSCVIHASGRQLVVEVVNFHFGGACLRLSEEVDLSKRDDHRLDFYLGQNCIQREVPFRISWMDRDADVLLGVEFLTRVNPHLERAVRFPVNHSLPICLTALDPVDPIRTVYFQVIDFSETGLLLRTSLTNKHLLPGMKLRHSQITFPAQNPVKIEAGIENTRKGSDPGTFLLGVAIRDTRSSFAESVRHYLAVAMPRIDSLDEHLKVLSNNRFLSKALKNGITYRVVAKQSEYDEVLKLRFSGYGKQSKVRAGTSWKEQGEGIEKEGYVIAGFVGGRVICSMELRFGTGALPLRIWNMMGQNQIEGVDAKRVVEINKLVVHPEAQGSDIVLGMIQRAHAIVVQKGQLDVLLVATDKLKPLYQRIGAVCVGKPFPHPYLEGQFLNPMIVRREVYHDGIRFNPHAWSVVYETLHEHFVGIGLASKRNLTMREQLTKGFSQKIVLIQEWRKKLQKKSESSDVRKVDERKEVHPNVRVGAAFVDPKWTRQELIASVMLPYIREAKEKIGSEKVIEILQKIGVPESYLAHQSNWLSIGFLDEFLEAYRHFGDVGEISIAAGHRSMKKDMLGFNYYVLKHFLTPEIAFSSLSKILKKFNRTRTYSLVESGPGRAKINIGLVAESLLPRDPASCSNWQASFESYCELMTGKPGRVKKVACCYKGDDACSYEIRWESTYKKFTSALPHFLSFMFGVSAWWYSKDQGPNLSFGYGLIVGLLTELVVLQAKHFWLRKSHLSSHKEFMRFQQDSAEKYAELQLAKVRSDEMYREGRLVEQTMREIQRSDDAKDVLQTALDALCTSFDFERSFAMLVDRGKETLRTAAVAGVDKSTDLLWKYEVDVSKKKDNPLLLSSVFHSGGSIVIDEIDSHLFQLNESSRQLVRQFGSAGFVIVAIPARDGQWGVIVADRTALGRKLSKRDTVVLERLSQQIGLALDKQSNLERERNLRVQFQKYAPSALIYSSESYLANAELGAKLRSIGAMLVDIRGFTAMSQSLPPSVLFEVLNGFFEMLDSVVRKHGGVVDKYLGDGALIVWGALGSSDPDACQMIECAMDVRAGLGQYNVELEKRGIPALQIGLGLHSGDAIVGAVGSQQRLEYTAIGPAINLASRLESLTKTFRCDIVVSDEMMTGVETKDGWECAGEVEVRGMAEPVVVWLYGVDRQKEFKRLS